MSNSTIEKLLNFVLTILVCGFIFCVIMILYCLLLGDEKDCKIYGQQTHRQVEYLSGTCYIQYGGIKIPYEEFIQRATTNENKE